MARCVAAGVVGGDLGHLGRASCVYVVGPSRDDESSAVFAVFRTVRRVARAGGRCGDWPARAVLLCRGSRVGLVDDG